MRIWGTHDLIFILNFGIILIIYYAFLIRVNYVLDTQRERN